MAIQTKNTAFAVTEEVTEGTPVAPSSGSDYLALQDGFEMVPAFNSLENAELRASIGAAKSIQGLEEPTASFQHYLRNSGVEGSEPNYHLFLKAAFGDENLTTTQPTTATGSTVSVIKIDTGGSVLERGRALLIKDSTNGYRIRPVLSYSAPDATLGFALPAGTAPAGGVSLGQCQNYSPANSDHPSLSLHAYRGAGGAYDVLAGAKVTEVAIEATAGELINATYSLEGVKYLFDPIKIDATNDDLDFVDSGSNTYFVSVEQKWYRDPIELADAIAAKMNGVGSVQTFTVTYSSSTGKYTISASVGNFVIKWNTGVHTATTIGTAIGFSTAADDTGASTYTSDNAITLTSPFTPSYDSADPVVAKNHEVLVGSSSVSACFDAQSIQFSLANTKTNVESICAETGVKETLFTARAVTATVTAILSQYDAENFKKFRANEEISFCYNLGNKSAGNWIAGTTASLYIPSAVITSFQLTDLDGVVGLELQIQGFVDSNGNGEVYLNFL